MINIISSPADEGGPQAYAKELILNRNVLLESLTAVSKAAAMCYIQLLDTPRRMNVAITDTDILAASLTAANHGFVTGDKVTVTGVSPYTTAYLRVINANTFSLHGTRAAALAGTDAIVPDADDDTGTFSLASDASSAPVHEEYPLAAAADAPSNVLSLTNARFRRGLYIRAVTAQNGSTLISGDDIKFTPRYRTGPNSNSLTYED